MGRKKINRVVEEKPKKERKPRKKRVVKDKPIRVKVRDEIETGERTHQEMINLGVIKPPSSDRYDMSFLRYPYFEKLPEILIVTPETKEGTKLWNAKDFRDGHRKEVHFLKSHRPSDEMHLVGCVIATDNENIPREFLYDAVCIVPSHHKAAQAVSQETIMEKINEAKQEAKKHRKKK